METNSETLRSLVIELKRGTTVLLVLSQLRTPEYGYSLVQKLEEKQAPLEPGTLYPLLRRLEKQNLLTSVWDTSESRPRKFYVLSEEGNVMYQQLKAEWVTMANVMTTIMREEETNGTSGTLYQRGE